MAINDLRTKITKMPKQQKALAVAGLVLLIGVVFYFVFYSDMSAKVDRLGKQIKQLEDEKASYQQKQVQYDSFRSEVKSLLAEKKELVKVLPTSAEIPSFLQSLHAQAELSGLNILAFEKDAETRQSFYATIPVKMAISGTYHQITKFFYSVGNLKRIVNIQDVLLDKPKKTDQGVRLEAKFVASTFRFIEPAAAAGAGAKAGAKPGGRRRKKGPPRGGRPGKGH